MNARFELRYLLIKNMNFRTYGDNALIELLALFCVLQ
jgi:hypothetical protein